MATIALIGGDGSGKTTVARSLIASSPVRMKYLYMGIHTPSANFALPTARLAHALKLRAHRKAGGVDTDGEAGPYRNVERSALGASIRLANRISEESYRQLISWYYQLRGFTVVYDRHFVFEYELSPTADDGEPLPLSERIHRWFLRRVYPRPGLVIMLDAEPEVLHQRQDEWGLDYQRNVRSRYLERSRDSKAFVRVDAAQPVEQVVGEVRDHVLRFLS